MEKKDKIKYLETLRSIKDSLIKLEEQEGVSGSLEQFREIVEEVNKWEKSVFEENQKVLQEWRETISTDNDVLLEHTETLMKEAVQAGKHE
jgi:hypothetical protein